MSRCSICDEQWEVDEMTLHSVLVKDGKRVEGTEVYICMDCENELEDMYE